MQNLDNQVPELKDYNLYSTDPALQNLVNKLGSSWDKELSAQGAELGSEKIIRVAEDANRYPPELHTHSRTGERIDFVKFHPSWHQMMELARRNGIANRCFADARPQSWIAYGASEYMHSQIESGTMCPSNMTQASIPVLQKEVKLFAQLKPKLFSMEHDARDIPWQKKISMTVGMGMTEKQGGSDLRAITTTATAHSGQGRGAEYLINGHKWFFSAPMCDAHLVLAKSDGGYSCFFVPRWREDGSKNTIEIQRLKDKVGNCSNASSEVEFHNAWGIMVGEEGRGIPTILEMATFSRVNCALASAGFLRQAFTQSLHYAKHRQAFGKYLVEQPLMTRVLADMALEAEAAMTLSMVLASQFSDDEDASKMAWRRIMTPAAKFWICKRAVEICGEAMEVFGGNGYVEEGPMGRLFRDAPVNSIWEGSGNVMCLDVLRAISRNPAEAEMVFEDMHKIIGDETRLLTQLAWLRNALKSDAEELEVNARLITQKFVLLAQACLLMQHVNPLIADLFIATRTDPDWGAVLGASSSISVADAQKILAISWQD
jgi:putative acyl-CoA dehydrogenase